MPRTARIVLPGYPHHVVQQGHNQSAVFTDELDFGSYLQALRKSKERVGCQVYSFCLMTNHVHLIIDPGRRAENLGLMMKQLAAAYTNYVNKIEKRSGTVWNGRYWSSVIDTDRYLLACSRYVELNPVRAGMVALPGEYPWSSYRDRSGRRRWGWLDEDPFYVSLGETRAERETEYRNWIRASVPEGEWQFIRDAVRRGQLTGGKAFRKLIERRIGRRIESRGPGRPWYESGG